VQQKVEDATASAGASPIPWDSDTAWHVVQKNVEISGYVVGNVVDGILYVDETATVTQYNAAQRAADYDVTTGSGRVVKTMTAASWATTQQQTKPVPGVYHGAVAPGVHQFDVWMEYLALNIDVHAAVSKAADRVEVALIDFLAAPSWATSPTYTAKSPVTGLRSGSTLMATMPGGDASGAYANGSAAPGASGTGTGSSSPTVGGGSSTWMPPGTNAAGAGLSGVGGVGGVGAVTIGSGGAAGGGFASVAGTTTGFSFGGAGTPVGTSAASAGGGMPDVMPAGVGGMGAPNQRKGNDLKVSGLSGTGAGITGLGTNPSFRMGSMGRGTAASGNVGGIDNNLPLGSLLGGQALMGGRNVRRKDDGVGELDETWLEEDQDVWGISGSRRDG
jgi:hypothetical protein